MAVMTETAAAAPMAPTPKRRSPYPGWFFLPAAIIYGVLFLLPTFASLYFSLTRWTLFNSTFIGLDNFAQFLREPFLVKGLINTVLYAVITSGLKVVLGLMLAVLLTSQIAARGYLRSVVFFPVLVSTAARSGKASSLPPVRPRPVSIDMPCHPPLPTSSRVP